MAEERVQRRLTAVLIAAVGVTGIGVGAVQRCRRQLDMETQLDEAAK